jgi:SPASM domain peptide maturase of grasp-with-spasm system
MGSDHVGTPMGNIIYVQQAITSNTHCGNISSLYFVFNNFRSIIEAHQHNTCLNKKISIDVDGAIKNCPTLADSYGNVKDTLLYDVLLRNEIQQLWSVSKDQVLVCQDCEYRMVCTDCRAIVSEPGNILSKPLKCTYDPYQMVWG